jgi:hypothetical protein
MWAGWLRVQWLALALVLVLALGGRNAGAQQNGTNGTSPPPVGPVQCVTPPPPPPPEAPPPFEVPSSERFDAITFLILLVVLIVPCIVFPIIIMCCRGLTAVWTNYGPDEWVERLKIDSNSRLSPVALQMWMMSTIYGRVWVRLISFSLSL